jgi:L-asparaginase
MAKTRIKIITTGGTIDKVYFDEKSTYEVGEAQIGEVLERSDVTFDHTIDMLCQKDSLDLTRTGSGSTTRSETTSTE